jgi:hypothetical protein
MTSASLKKAEVSTTGKARGKTKMTTRPTVHKNRMSLRPLVAMIRESDLDRLPNPWMRETTIYGSTAIWSNLMKALPMKLRGRTISPKNRPTNTPQDQAEENIGGQAYSG